MQNRIIGVIGKTGSGKTVYAAELFAVHQRAAVFNTANDDAYYRGATVRSDDCLALIRSSYWNGNEFRAVLDSDDNVRARKKQNGEITLVYYELDTFIEACYQRGHMTMFLEEAHDLCSRQSATFWLLKAARRGRHNALSTVWVSQRFATIHTSLTGNAHELIFMPPITEPTDIDDIERRCGEETVEAIRSAPKYHPVIWREEGGLQK